MEYLSSNWEKSKVLYMDIGIVALGKGIHIYRNSFFL